MIDGLKVLAVIPARGGSKGLTRKNIRKLGGRPLIAWTLAAAQASRRIDRCIVSTDDQEIAAVARACGGDVPFMRPAELATDTATAQDVLEHTLEQLPGFDIVVILQPTSPLRSNADIDGTIETMLDHDATSCVSVVEPGKSPYWSYTVNARNQLTPLLDPAFSRMRRQDLPQAFVLNGAVYAAHRQWLLDNGSALGEGTVPYVMPVERSVDIDTAFDLELAALYLRSQQETSAA